MDTVTDEMINEALSSLNTIVPGWDGKAPNFTKTCIDVPIFIWHKSNDAFFAARWHIQYTLMKQKCSDSDRQEMCRRHFNKTTQELSIINLFHLLNN